MKRSTRYIKKALVTFLVVLMSINTFAAVVGDNDGAAFITKAEFDSLKNDFQSQLDRYNSSIDNKIDGAIASYLAGIKLSTHMDVQNIIDKKYVWLEVIGDSSALGWRRPNTSISLRSYVNVYFFQSNLTDTITYLEDLRNGTIYSVWSPKDSNPTKMEIYSFDSVSATAPSGLINPRKDKRAMTGDIMEVYMAMNSSGARFWTSNYQNALWCFGNIMYNKDKTENGGIYEDFCTVDWQQGLCWGKYYDALPFTYQPTSKFRNVYNDYWISFADNENGRLVWTSRPYDGSVANLSAPTSRNSNYMIGGSGSTIQQQLTWAIDDNDTSLLGLVGDGTSRTLQFFDADAGNIWATHARTVKDIPKADLKYNISGYMYLYRFKTPYYDSWTNDNTLTMDADNSYTTKDLVLADGIKTWYDDTETKWPNTLPYDFLIPSIWFDKTLDKSLLAYYNDSIINKSVSTKLSDYLKNYSWNRGFPMWEVENNGTLTFEPVFKDTTKNYLMWVLKGPSNSNIPYTTAPTNYYKKNRKCTLTQIASGNGKGAIKCKSGDKIIVDDIEKGDIVYLYFTTEDGKAGSILKNGIQANLEIE